MSGTRDRSYVHRLYTVPLLIILILLGFFAYALATQRAQELRGLSDRAQLQTSLLAQKISSRMNTFELLLQILEGEIALLDSTERESTSAAIEQIARRQLLLHEDLESMCVLLPDGEKLYSSYAHEFNELALLHERLLTSHMEQHLQFSLLSFIDHDAHHMVVSRPVMDSDQHITAIIALIIETERFFDQLSVSVLPGMSSALLYDMDGSIFATWSNVSYPEARIDPSARSVQELALYRNAIALEDHEKAIQGGVRIHRVENMIIAFSSMTGYPMTFALSINIPEAMAPFDRSLAYSFSAVLLLLLVALLFDHRYVRKSWETGRLQQQMVQELSVQVQQRTADLEKLSVVDSLTGLANRRRFNEELESAILVHERIGVAFSIIAVDLDGFKQVNDTHGHLVGDAILTHISRLLAETVGSLGTVARWGGDELMVILPELDRTGAADIAHRLCRVVDGEPYDHKVHCTISLGVAEHLIHESSLDLIRRADDALYQAKGEGKNRVIVAAHRLRVKS